MSASRFMGGELLILIGGSGSGKTTTLRMINRLVDPDDGSVLINGTDCKTVNEIALRKNIGYVIQQIGLFPHMTVRENIGLVPTIEGWSRDQVDERVRSLLTLVHLPPELYMDRYPKELSGGQQQRIGLARALVMDPPLLLMDEPFGALDPLLRQKLQDEFIGIKQNIGKTIVFVTHDINEAFRLGDRIAIMHEGRIVQVGTPRDLILHPADSMVSDLVGSDSVFRHLETLSVSDLSRPLAESSIYPHDALVHEVIRGMKQSGHSIAVVEGGHIPFGVVRLLDLALMTATDVPVSDAATAVLPLDGSDPVLPALQRIREEGCFAGLQMMASRPVALFVPDEVMERIIPGKKPA